MYVNGKEYMEFELEGDVISREGYIAIAMSPDKKEVSFGAPERFNEMDESMKTNKYPLNFK